MATSPRCARSESRSHVAAAARFLEALAERDFDTFGGSLTPDATMTALVPRGLRECASAGEIGSMFTRWFGDTPDFELVEAEIGEIGERLHFRWLVRIRAERIGIGFFDVEQHAYIETDTGRISRIRLLSSGYCPSTSTR